MLEEEFIRKPDPEERIMGIHMMEMDCKEIKPSERKIAEFAPLLAECLNDPEPQVRAQAVRVLGVFKIKYYAKFVVKLLADSEGNVRGNTVWTLDQLDARQYYSEVEKLKNDEAIWQDGNYKKQQVGEFVKTVITRWAFINKKTDTPP